MAQLKILSWKNNTNATINIAGKWAELQKNKLCYQVSRNFIVLQARSKFNAQVVELVDTQG